MEYRYDNIKLKFMQEISTKNNKDGKPVIYVQKCDKFVRYKWKSVKKMWKNIKNSWQTIKS